MSTDGRPWTVTRADPADLDSIAALEIASFSNPWTRQMLANQLRDSTLTRLYVLSTPELRVGAFCFCWLIVDDLQINTVAVDASLRRQGVATYLLEYVLKDAAAEGARRATLEVRRSNAAALRLYARLGFKVTAERPRYYTEPEEDALVLWLSDVLHAVSHGREGGPEEQPPS